jgi:sterol desaturase/sphingolipid hydroxylase (fatty acid hydroxylase superfamily)
MGVVCRVVGLVRTDWLGLLYLWCAYSVVATLLIAGGAALVFRWLYWRPTFATWRRKTIAAYPSVDLVAQEILLGCVVGPPTVALLPAIHLWLVARGALGGCGQPTDWLWSVVLTVVLTDLYEWAWHRVGHTVLWRVHHVHHGFPNPTPFATIADLPPDNLMRSAYPAVVLSAGWVLGVTIDLDVLYVAATVVNVLYGLALHSGHEIPWLDAGNPIVNTPYHHTLHHAVSAGRQVVHTGFLLKCWDQLAGSVYTGTALCPVAQQARTLSSFRAVDKPDYGPLVRPAYWLGRVT